MTTLIREVMASPPMSVGSRVPVNTAAGMMRDHDIGSLPVVDEGHLTGILTDRDIIVRCVANGRPAPATFVGELCSREIQAVEPDDTTRTAAQLMRLQAVRRLPVVEGSRLVGMVSIGDLARSSAPGSPLADVSEALPNN